MSIRARGAAVRHLGHDRRAFARTDGPTAAWACHPIRPRCGIYPGADWRRIRAAAGFRYRPSLGSDAPLTSGILTPIRKRIENSVIRQSVAPQGRLNRTSFPKTGVSGAVLPIKSDHLTASLCIVTCSLRVPPATRQRHSVASKYGPTSRDRFRSGTVRLERIREPRLARVRSARHRS